MAPKSPLGVNGAKTGSSKILPMGQTEQAHFGTNGSLQAKNGGRKESTLPG